MATLKNILDRLQQAVEQKNQISIFQVIDEFCLFVKAAFTSPQTKLDWSDEGHSIEVVIEMGNINEELCQIQSILQADQQDLYLSRLSLALDLAKGRMHENGTWNIRSNQTMAMHFLGTEVRYDKKPYSKINDLSFLSKPNTSNLSHPQSVLGKEPKGGSFLFPEKYIWMMSPSYWKHDVNGVPYFTPSEKKLMKVKRHEDGILNRPMDSNNKLPDGSYLYAISPKGGLYTCQSHEDEEALKQAGITTSGLHHSSFRAGQPVLCAGSIKVENGEIIQIDTGSGHYAVPNVNLLMACLHLHQKGILNNTCKIMSYGEKEEITVQNLLDNPKYESLRIEYSQLLGAQEEFDQIVHLINTNFALDKHLTIAATPLTINAKGPLLYPCSGSDVTYPLLLCPDVNEFYLLDQHPLFEPGSPEFHSAFHKNMTESSSKVFKIGEALGAWGGYDCTNPQRSFEYLQTHELGLILMLRLRQLCEMDIHDLKVVTSGVYKITGTINGEKKTIYYVQHDLGTNSEAYQWLQQQVSHKPIRTLFLKAFSASINETAISPEFFQQFQQLMPSDRSNMTVISDTCSGYSGYKRNHVPDVLEPHAINQVQTVPFDFGYDSNKMIVANGEVLATTYSSIEQRQKIRSDELLEQQRQSNELARIAAQDLAIFHQLNPTEKISILIAKDYMRQNDTSITFILDDSSFLMQRLQPSINQLLNFLTNNSRITSVKIEMKSPCSGFSHIYALLKPIINALPTFSSVQSLEISAPERKEVSFRSEEAKMIAEELRTSGQNLVNIDVQVNDGGALAFASTFTTLKNHALRSGNIRPIDTWSPITETQVNDSLASFPQSGDTPSTIYRSSR